jgi:thiol:disulfide interchange protein DsbA
MKPVAPLVLAAVLALCAVGAFAVEPVEGKDYLRVNPAVPTSDASKIVVTEFFSYQCPHCYAFAKSWTDWTASLPKDVKADRAAVAIGHAGWVAPARAFYALSALKAVPGIDDAFFAAIHRERKRLTDEAGIADWMAGQGIDRAQFLSAYRSFSVQVQTKRADDLTRRVQLPSVPAILIDGKYVLPVSDDGNFKDQLALAETLIARARAQRTSAASASR